MAPENNVDPYGIIPSVSKKSNTELDKFVARGGIGDIVNTPPSPFRKGLEKTGATLISGLGVGGAGIIDTISSLVDNIVGTKTPALLPKNIDAFGKSLSAWNLGIGTPSNTSTTPTTAPVAKPSMSAQAPVPGGITPSQVSSTETVNKPVSGSGIEPYTPPPGWETKLGMQDFSKYATPTEYRMDKGRGIIEARKIDTLANKPVDETQKSLGIIDKELTKPNLNESTRTALLKERAGLVGHTLTAKTAADYHTAALKIAGEQKGNSLYERASSLMEKTIGILGKNLMGEVNPELAYFKMGMSNQPLPSGLSPEESQLHKLAIAAAMEPAMEWVKEAETKKGKPLTPAEKSALLEAYQRKRFSGMGLLTGK
jgi:hypothetical protein